MISWGVIAGLTAFVRTPMQFYVVRFFLGMAEAGFSPGIMTPDASHRMSLPRLQNEPSESSAPVAAYACSTRKSTRPCAATSRPKPTDQRLFLIRAGRGLKRGTLNAPCWPSQKLFRNLGGFSSENDLCYTDR